MKTINDYAELVKEKHALNKTIAPVEADETDASKAYAVGEQLILSGILYDVIAPISQHDVITTTGSGANIAPAGPISSKIQTLTNNLADEVSARAKLGAHNFFTTKNTGGRGPYTSWTTEASGIRLSNSQSSTYCYQQFIQNLQKNTDYTISADITVASGSAGIVIKGDATNILTQLNISGSVKYTFNTGNYDTIAITFYCVTDTAAVGNVLYDNLLVKLATDKDETYQPYAKTNQELTAENQTLTNEVDTIVNDLGAKNILPFDLAYAKKNNKTGAWNNNAYSITGVTFTVNDDNTVTVNGTATADTYFRVYYETDLTGMLEVGKKYILSGCPSGVSQGVGALYINGMPNIVSIDGSEAEFTFDTSVNRTTISILVHNGATVTNKVFEPMMRRASIKSSTYQPYAMTNRELTDNVQFYNANTDGTVKQNHYAIAKGIGETLAIGGMVTKLVRFSGNYTDFMIISKNDSGYIYCIDFMANSGFGKIMSFRYNPGTDVFTDEFIIS